MNHSLKDSIEPANEPVQERRTRKRFFLNFSIEITGFDRNGNPFVERTRTEDISESGCRLNTSVLLQSGNLLDIRLIPPDGERLPEEDAQQFEVMWVSKVKVGWSVGVRKLRREKIWKVSFPPPKLSCDPHTN